MVGIEPQQDSPTLAAVYAPVEHVAPRSAVSSLPGEIDPLGAEPAGVELPLEGRSLDEVLASIERREILAALDRAEGQRTMAAQMLRISRSRLYRRMEALGINSRGDGSNSET